MYRLRKITLGLIFFFLFTIVSGNFATTYAGPEKAVTAQLSTTATSAVVMDENGTVLFEKDAHKPLPPASVTKTMTLLLAVEAVEQGKVNLSDEIYTSETAWRQGGSQIWLEPGEKMTARELMIAVAVVSANDAAVALMEHIYGSSEAAIEAMNQRVQSLGLKNTHFANVNGLPASDHYMSAYDTAMITKEAVSHPLYMELCGIKEYWLRDGKNWLVNTNKLLWWYKGADGLKTGWTEEAKYCFAGTAKRDGLRLISVVFASPEPRSHLRESMKLMDWGFANYAAVPIANQGDIVERLAVNRGVEKEVQLVAAQNLNLTVVKGQSKNIQKKVIANPSVAAPIKQGQKYGELVVMKEGKELAKVDLVAEKDVAKAGFVDIFQNMIVNLFTLVR